MSIESKISPDNINIRDLSINSPEHGEKPLFDVAGAIDQKKWEEIIELQKSADVQQMLSDGEAIRIISPEIFEQVKMSDEEYQKFYDTQVTKSGFQNGRILSAAYLKSAYPQKNTLQGLEEGDKEKLAFWASNANDCKYAYLYKILYPEDRPELMLNAQFRENILSTLSDQLKHAREIKNWEHFVYSAMETKFIFPEIIDNLSLSPTDWEGMKKQISQMPAKSEFTSSSLTRYLSGLKILAAGTAEITKDGIQLTPPKEFISSDQKNSLPEVKKF